MHFDEKYSKDLLVGNNSNLFDLNLYFVDLEFLLIEL